MACLNYLSWCLGRNYTVKYFILILHDSVECKYSEHVSPKIRVSTPGNHVLSVKPLSQLGVKYLGIKCRNKPVGRLG